jgi:hypothetical protein
MEIDMQTLEELHAHYMAVRARLNGVKPKPALVQPPEPKAAPEPPEPVLEQPVVETHRKDWLWLSQLTEMPSLTILREVSEKHGMTIRNMKSQSREIQFVKARQEAAYRLKFELNYSLTQIGRLLGKRDHTTILHAINRHKKNLAQGTEPWTRQVAFTGDPDTRT